MFENLTENEKEIMFLNKQEHNFTGILDFVGIDYPTFIGLKKSLFKKTAYFKNYRNFRIIASAGL